MSGAGSARGVGRSGIPRHNALGTSGTGNGYDYDRDDPTFLHDLRASREAVDCVARWFMAGGRPVVVYPTFERPTPGEMKAYRDAGDMSVLFRVEVTQRSFNFSSRADYPYDTVQIVQCHRFDGVHPVPWLYVLTSADLRHALTVNVSTTRTRWARVPRYIPKYDRTREFYECALGDVAFVDLGVP